ncbi:MULTISPECIES: hypothetical protein [Variovorax]|jgi:hypothetical protein|uniref:hypothetical protein n=1 Tax=Variovorax TaxID=34072 RepID=UPI0008B24992|nr:hypothetical protein [Variovorax sp. OV084]SEU15586.1 hypothetical protein SAMN05443580_1193 [Variovorax sp. OV084]
MGILSDFFVASPEEALRYANRIEEPDEGDEIEELLEPVQYKRFTDIEITTLWAIMEGKEWDVDRHMLEYVELGEDNDAWLNRFPDELTTLLTQVDSASLAPVLERWANTEELACEPTELHPVMEDLRRLAAEALARNKSVYLWGCL